MPYGPKQKRFENWNAAPAPEAAPPLQNSQLGGASYAPRSTSESCDEPRGGMDASQNKDYVLVLLSLLCQINDITCDTIDS